MNAKNLCYLIMFCAGSSVMAPNADAQDVAVGEYGVSVTEFSCDDTDRYSQSWRDNWFIQLGAGVNQPFVERGINGGRASGPIVNRHAMTATYNIGVGHWFSPYVGFRMNALGGALHWNNPNGDKAGVSGWSKANHVNLNLEFMWDMCNSLGGVDPDRVFSVIPFAGVGGDYTWGFADAVSSNIGRGSSGKVRNSSWTLPVTAGIQFRVRLCKYIDFFAEARASFYGDNWNGCSYGRPIESNVAAIGGFNINIGGRTWNIYNDCAKMSEFADLNNQINSLRAENLASAQAIAALESQLPCPEPVVQKDCVNAPLMTTVRFNIDSDVIMPTEEVNVYNMAEWLKSNPDQKVVIVGYADKDTGTSEYNMALSKRRADTVANELINKYGIDGGRLVVKYDGSDVQPYDINDWNRIVIFSQE